MQLKKLGPTHFNEVKQTCYFSQQEEVPNDHQWRLPSFQTHDICPSPQIRYWSPRHHCRKSSFHWPSLSRPFLHTDGSQCMGGWQGHCPVTERCVPRIFCQDDILNVGHCTLNCSKVITRTPIFAKSSQHHCRMKTPSFGTQTPENRLESTHTQ